MDIVFHGTRQVNVGSIMSQSLAVSKHGGRYWMARSICTTCSYGPTTIVLAALHDKSLLHHDIITSDSATHQLALGYAVGR